MTPRARNAASAEKQPERSLLQRAQDFEDFFVRRLRADGIHLREGDLPFFINHEDGAVGDAWDGVACAQHAELLGDAAVREEVAAQRVIENPDIFFLPRDVAED